MGSRLATRRRSQEVPISTRTALVGGGTGGIGYAIAGCLARDGHRVVITGRRPDALTAAQVHPIGSDVVDPAAPLRMLDEVWERYGGLDVLVLNAGGPTPGRILDVEDAQWQADFDLLVRGPLRVARLALPAMAARGFGRLVFITSTAVRQPQPDLPPSGVLPAPGTSAAKLLSREVASPGVTVNCVAPGPTATRRRHEILAAPAERTGESRDDPRARDAPFVPPGLDR